MLADEDLEQLSTFLWVRSGYVSKMDYKWCINIVLISFPFFLLVLQSLAWFLSHAPTRQAFV